MAIVRVYFDVYDVPKGDTASDSKTINRLIDDLASVRTELSWDCVEWYDIEGED